MTVLQQCVSAVFVLVVVTRNKMNMKVVSMEGEVFAVNGVLMVPPATCPPIALAECVTILKCRVKTRCVLLAIIGKGMVMKQVSIAADINALDNAKLDIAAVLV